METDTRASARVKSSATWMVGLLSLSNVRRQLPCPVGDNYLDRLTDM